MNQLITAERLRELFAYNPDTGDFIRRVGRSNNAKAGTKAGSISAKYLSIRIDGVLYYCHRLAVLYMTGNFPSEDVDHVNLNKLDNRWSNLREATRTQNLANVSLRSDNALGVKGVHVTKFGRFRAEICRHGKVTLLGNYLNVEDAAAAYAKAANENFGEFARVA